MASQLKVDTITGVTTAGSVAVTAEGNSTTTNLQQGLAKAWAELDGTGTIGLSDSFNIASVADNGTGDYTFTYTNAMGGTDYSYMLSGNSEPIVYEAGTSRSANLCRALIRNSSNAATDTDPVSMLIHGDLA
tara:strand:- start:70 stop:465 length:396 start_codon:yes stop_codon:yes gene_type:complete